AKLLSACCTSSPIPARRLLNRSQTALKTIGSGGGHARMAGGYADGAKLPEEEALRNHEIRRLFNEAIKLHLAQSEKHQYA
ncbi:MAG: hypothetical protein IJN11_07305, partial [Oscillospiraceae bacterium]|nr:hypothetical protein [Oscillospiraceae bacterium]